MMTITTHATLTLRLKKFLYLSDNVWRMSVDDHHAYNTTLLNLKKVFTPGEYVAYVNHQCDGHY